MTTKKSFSKFSIVAIVLALLVVGGGTSAFFLMNKTPKQAYFYSEINTAKHLTNVVEQRYQNEFKWRDTEKNSVTEHIYDLSAELDFYDSGASMIDEELITLLNSATATLQVTTDPKNRQATADVSASIANASVDGIQAFITPEKLLLTLPFLDEWIQLKDDEFGTILHKINEHDYTGDEKLGLSNFMKKDAFLSEADRKYLQKEYIEFLYNQLPDKAFTSEKENINVYDKKMKATKISMNLSEQEVKSILTTLLEKAQNDAKLHEIMENQIKENSLLSQYSEEQLYTELSEFTNDFKNAMGSAIKNMDSLYLEDGIQSTIWQVSDLIVKRDSLFAIGVDNSTEVNFSLKGTQLPDKTAQRWDYTLETSDDYDDYSMDFSGELSWEDNQSADRISFFSDDFKFSYDGNEELEKNVREFSRNFRISGGYDEFHLIWDGTATHEKDSKLVNHTFSVNVEDEKIGLNITDQSKIVKKVEQPKEKIINLGDMNINELEDFITFDIQDGFENWIESFVIKMERFF